MIDECQSWEVLLSKFTINSVFAVHFNFTGRENSRSNQERKIKRYRQHWDRQHWDRQHWDRQHWDRQHWAHNSATRTPYKPELTQGAREGKEATLSYNTTYSKVGKSLVSYRRKICQREYIYCHLTKLSDKSEISSSLKCFIHKLRLFTVIM